METVVYIKLQNDKNFRIKSNTTRMILNQLLNDICDEMRSKKIFAKHLYI